MTIPAPKLDTRSWAELVAEGRAVVPRYTAAWTDHNIHDPGITLLELYAWISEILLFRLDSVPPSAIRSFLRWAGVSPFPPQVASTVIAIETAASATLAGPVQVVDSAAGSGPVFEHPEALSLSPAWIDLSPPAGPYRARVFSSYKVSSPSGTPAAVTVDHTIENATRSRPYLALGPSPGIDDALILAFDVPPAAAGDAAQFYVFTASFPDDAATRDQLIAEWQASLSDCPPEPPVSSPTREDCAKPPHPSPLPPPTAGWQAHYSARTVWEYFAGAAIGWKPLPKVVDETRALSLSGGVSFSGAVDFANGPGDVLYRIRCRLISGEYECPPLLAQIAINAAPFGNAAVLASLPEQLGVSDGSAHQQYSLARAPVVAGSVQLHLEHGADVDDSWQEVSDWDASGPADKHFRLQPETALIEFGNGRVGLVPPADWALSALSYWVGGGIAGNLPAARLTRLLSPALPGATVWQPLAAAGGASAETLDRAHGRALDYLARPTRAITIDDCRSLALATPGVPVARAAAIPNHHPDHPCIDGAGVVTVVVLPACGSPPVPGPDFVAAVQRYLERRRPITTELHVVAPDYMQLSVIATLHVAGAGPITGLSDLAAATLNEFFHPLRGGPDGKGWPFGRPALETDVLAILGGLPTVAYVDGVMLGTSGGAARCGCVNLCPTTLIDARDHRINVVRELGK